MNIVSPPEMVGGKGKKVPAIEDFSVAGTFFFWLAGLTGRSLYLVPIKAGRTRTR